MVDTFTPEQITQILEEFFKVVGTRKYIGERYVPIFGRKGEESIEWDNSAPYEPLTIVLYQGNSYTSRQYVPIGVEITNQEFWVITGNYNAQVEAYHRETIAAREIADNAITTANNAITTANNAQNDIDTLLPKADFSSENTVKKYIDENPTRILTFDTVADMQAATMLKSDMVCHTNGFHAIGDGGAAYYTIGARGDIACANGLYATLVQTGGAKAISIEQLETVGAGVYTLGTVRVDSPIQLPRQQNRQIIIVDTVFNINTPVLFPSFNTGYFVLPSFVGCVFNNVTNNRVLITSGSSNTVGSHIVGCNFMNVDMVEGGYIQNFNLTSCYIQSYDTFFDTTNSTVQTRMVNCNVESECKKLIDCKSIYAYLSGTYEGNSANDYYFIMAQTGRLYLDACWIEGCKLASLTGSSNTNSRSIIGVSNTQINGNTNSAPVIEFTDHPESCQLFINESIFAPYNNNSRFTNATPSQLGKVVGTFVIGGTPETYCYPIGGVDARSYQLATMTDINALDNSRFISRKFLLSDAVIASGGIDISDIPVGEYLMVVGRGSYSVFDVAAIHFVGASNENSTYTNVINLIATSDAYLNELTFTATKANASDKTFTLNVNSSRVFTLHLTLVKLF